MAGEGAAAYRVLLVDDDEEQRSSLAELLRGDGFHVVSASDGSDALTRLRDGVVPDLILLDLMMPVKDGWQFRLEQRQDPAISAIPVIAMSADCTAKAAAIDAERYLRKPFDYAALRGAIQEVIEQRRLEHLDRMASLGTLAAGIAHEINNPLTYVIANLQLLEEELPRMFQDCVACARSREEEQATQLSGAINRMGELGARLRDALDGAERVRNIVLHVKTFSRAGDDHRSPLDVRSVLDSSIKVVFAEIRPRARLVKDYAHTPLVHANAGQLGQVFLNLLLNAAHAIPDDEPHRNVIRVGTSTSPSGQVVVEISDTGAGIPVEIRHRIFDPFFTTKPLGSGTGLGLSICHGIIRSVGGSISVDSEVGRGSTFRVTLPAAPADLTGAVRAPNRPPRRGRVLIIDDEPRVAAALQGMIGCDHDAAVALSAEDALALLTGPTESYDVILCDLHMPGMSGMDLYEHVAAELPKVAERMVFMSGGAFTEHAQQFVASVSNRCLDKPLDMHAVRALIASRVAERADEP